MKGRDDRHIQPRQQLCNMAARRATEYSILVLQGDNVVASLIEKLGSGAVFFNGFVVYLKAYTLRICIDPAGVCHCHDPGFKVGSAERDCPMQVAGKGRNAA